jgi:hypothetical protein
LSLWRSSAHGVGHHRRVTDRDEFLSGVHSALFEAEFALHNGEADLRRALWSRDEPVSIVGAARNAFSRRDIDAVFTALENSFSHCTSYRFELQSFDVLGDMA